MKEIGGYFGFEQLIDEEYYPQLHGFDSARSCLLYLIRKKNIQKIYLPIYLCDCIEIVLKRENIAYQFYEINEHFKPVFDIKLLPKEYLYLVNFYGQLTQEEVKNYKEQFDQIIVDNVQAFFQPPIKGIDTIYTCRKFFGVPDGAYLATNLQWTEEVVPRRTAQDRIRHIIGRNEVNATEYYSDYIENEKDFDTNEIYQMSILAKNILGAIPYEQVKKIRTRNVRTLHDYLKGKNQLDYKIVEGAFAYPLLVNNGETLRKKLIEHSIYVPVLWPNVIENAEPNSLAYKYASNILPLPCDQRYCDEDMQHICNVIEQYIN